MKNIFIILMAVAAGLVGLSLAVGIFSMVKGGEFNKKYGNKLMRMRVTLQGLALAMFALAMWAQNSETGE